MGLNYQELDDGTRQYMSAEIKYDHEHKFGEQKDNFYYSNFLTASGKEQWPALLEESIAHDDVWLEREIIRRGILAQTYPRRKPNSTEMMQAKVPSTGAQTLAEGEFSRLYARGLCAKIISEGGTSVEAYRARHSENPRPESIAIIGKHFKAADVLQDIRDNPGVNTYLGLPPGPNSGISIKRI